MIVNAQRLVDKVRLRLNDPSGIQQGNQWSDTEILDFLNQTQESLVARTIQASEDFFGTYRDMALQAGVSIYPLYDGFLYMRKIDYRGPGGANADDPGDVTESRMTEGVTIRGGLALPGESSYYYALYGNDLHLNPTPGQDEPSAIRQWFIQEPGPVLLETPTTFPDASNIKFGSPDAPWEDGIMIGSKVDIVAGTGFGQRRQITAYVGSTQTATVDTPFSPAPVNGVSKVATISRCPRLFHRILYLGAALQAKLAVGEDARGLSALYNETSEEFEDFIERARTYSQRRAPQFDPEEI